MGPLAANGAWDGLRRSQTGLLLAAVLVGAGAGLGAVGFRWLIEGVTKVLSGHDDYSSAGHAPNPYVPWLGLYFVLLAPVVAGAIYGPLVYRYAKEARGHGVPEVMYAVARQGGRIAPRVAVVKSIASALCIGGGGSVGREGPIVQIGSALGSTAGAVLRMDEERMRLMVACGAAGGIAATFNAPLAGVFFAMELILRDFTARGFGMVAVSAVTASVIGRAALGDERFLDLTPVGVDHVAAYALYVLLGVVAGAVGVLFTKVLYWVEDICDAVWHGPEWLRPAVGGLLLGAILLALPEMYGVGYPVLGKAAVGGYAVGFLLVLLVGKIVACSVTIGIGGSGGVFAPSLFVGAMLGSSFGQTMDHLAPGVTGSAMTYAVIGMGAVFAGSARAPITAVIIIFELTGEYGIILPLMAAIAVATGVSHALSRDTVYTAKLRRRGVDLDLTGPAAVEVRTAMGPPPLPLAPNTPLREAAAAMITAGAGRLPVVDAHGRYEGSVGAQALARALAETPYEDASGEEPVQSVREFPPTLLAGQSLAEALPLLAASDSEGLAVLDEEGRHLLGWISHRSALLALHPQP
ncbi:chloride channel protein [Streptomyces sp. NBC_00503]|uniref:chloride channel protein n=1 Tax=Streptomyces sp. NBC_00503 TaxID=2903659 RepID=UPI002E81CCC1|nr:chloride channel protein [Streptomyces sp. NBC_00503]WUD85165.1 chloride channel protein [Streptomyces sp. NBC_00503]